MSEQTHPVVLGIVGSLREASLNRALLREAIARSDHAGLRILEGSIGALPMYCADLEEPPVPEVEAFQQAVADATALLIVTPEHNFNVPAALKNAIDWASRPPRRALADKPTAIMGASTGLVGTARAQMALRQSFVFTSSPCMPGPEYLLADAASRFDERGQLVHQPSIDFLDAFLERFRGWIDQLAR